MPQLPPQVRDLALLLARLVAGIVFIAHGMQKFVQWGISGTADSFAGMGIPAPQLSAWVAALIETVGGIALLLGIALPVAGVLLALNMLGALVLVHLDQGFFSSGGGYEYTLVLAVIALALGFNGGRYALDRALSSSGSRAGRERTGESVGV
ncbi:MULTISPECIES: DoxX family protein [unclassified Actinopolyspora]|uniref:DoxX family protein n=1 Tax=Actinopolyspora TaxID=1849 RepID=UPI0013F5AEA2|nr:MULTISPECIES: DoxX family protein [unclassified Actinopolyspora]NHD18841.1 DoxX family protein [Actinopolyspora sp. BKK2]NHE77264.1 DoxX family protein [Actinopolyspora sp. BKK1]